ncbi:MAG: NAD(+) synthase [Acholeplasmatales bacterium]|nr:MAG: NAD(+) synthase [Acholeplasmatales bacterium]
MYYQDFVKVASITPKLEVGNPSYNVSEMLNILQTLKSSIAVFPELGISAYTCNDLFFQQGLLEEVKENIARLLADNPFKGILVIGAPVEIDGILYNSALVIQGDKILGIVPKFYLPNTQEFYEKRWFTSGFDIVRQIKNLRYLDQFVPFGSIVFKSDDGVISFGVEICEDMWAPISPGNLLALNGAKMILNLSASNEYLHKRAVRRRAIIEHSRRNAGAYVFSSAGVHESTSETVFSGHNVIAQNGDLLVETESFSRDNEIIYGDIDLSRINYARKLHSSFRDTLNKFPIDVVHVEFNLPKSEEYHFESPIDQTPFVPKSDHIRAFEKIAALQENALIKRIQHIGSKTIIIGVSGGLDSTLAMLIATRVADQIGMARKNIIGVTMPAFGTSEKTLNQAKALINHLKVTLKEIDIRNHVNDHFSLIGHDSTTLDAAYENTQARARTMILMNLANMHEGIVLGTGDMSELALGWCTYNGDQMSMYGINAGIPKTLVRFMIEHYAHNKFNEAIEQVVHDVLETPISPELILNQLTEDAIGKYEVNDFILHRFLRFGDTEARIAWLIGKTFDLDKQAAQQYVTHFFSRFYSQQFKRQASPDSPKIIDISLSPRSDLRMPSDVNKTKR